MSDDGGCPLGCGFFECFSRSCGVGGTCLALVLTVAAIDAETDAETDALTVLVGSVVVGRIADAVAGAGPATLGEEAPLVLRPPLGLRGDVLRSLVLLRPGEDG